MQCEWQTFIILHFLQYQGRMCFFSHLVCSDVLCVWCCVWRHCAKRCERAIIFLLVLLTASVIPLCFPFCVLGSRKRGKCSGTQAAMPGMLGWWNSEPGSRSVQMTWWHLFNKVFPPFCMEISDVWQGKNRIVMNKTLYASETVTKRFPCKEIPLDSVTTTTVLNLLRIFFQFHFQ